VRQLRKSKLSGVCSLPKNSHRTHQKSSCPPPTIAVRNTNRTTGSTPTSSQTKRYAPPTASRPSARHKIDDTPRVNARKESSATAAATGKKSSSSSSRDKHSTSHHEPACTRDDCLQSRSVRAAPAIAYAPRHHEPPHKRDDRQPRSCSSSSSIAAAASSS
jgi:hypothetical protein